MSKTVKMKCPVTGSDEITLKYPDPNELVTTQRKGPDGKYRRVLKPRKEVRGALKPLVSCPSQQHPVFAGLPPALKKRLMEEGKAWCMKRRVVCPLEEILNKRP